MTIFVGNKRRMSPDSLEHCVSHYNGHLEGLEHDATLLQFYEDALKMYFEIFCRSTYFADGNCFDMALEELHQFNEHQGVFVEGRKAFKFGNKGFERSETLLRKWEDWGCLKIEDGVVTLTNAGKTIYRIVRREYGLQ